jgi:hypothetical protein
LDVARDAGQGFAKGSPNKPAASAWRDGSHFAMQQSLQKKAPLTGNGIPAGFSVLVRLAYKVRGQGFRAPQE